VELNVNYVKHVNIEINRISRDRCGHAGFDKILLFIYLFNVIECKRLETMKRFSEYLGILDTGLLKAIC
jgi:hypothetical protein